MFPKGNCYKLFPGGTYPFSLRDIVPLGNLNPLLPERTWCGLPFYFLHEAFDLKKLPKGYFLFINFIHGKKQ
jgi:hypothetical protein